VRQKQGIRPAFRQVIGVGEEMALGNQKAMNSPAFGKSRNIETRRFRPESQSAAHSPASRNIKTSQSSRDQLASAQVLAPFKIKASLNKPSSRRRFMERSANTASRSQDPSARKIPSSLTID
jgi:hypothetical protein